MPNGGAHTALPPASPRNETPAGPGIELKRRGEAHEVAALVAFLCSAQASFITGANYRVDGGSVATV